MSEPKPEPASNEPEDEQASEIEQAVANLRLANDVDGLMQLAKQYRAGQGVPRDMHACLVAYSAAAELGNPVAAHAVGLFYLNGGVVERDEKVAAAQFRAAADHGHLPSKILIANFYELGIHYRADAAKADVWYRSAARAAEVEAEAGTPEYAKALADLGAVRYCLEIAELPATDAAEKARLLKLAKQYGYRPNTEDRASASPMDPLPPPSRVIAPDATPPPRAAAERPPASEASLAKSELAPTPKRKTVPAPKANVGLGATAFVYTLVFMAVGIVGGHLLDAYAKGEAAASRPLPVLGTHGELALPIVVGALGLLPNMLVYRRSAFFRAVLVSAAAGIAGDVLFGMGQRFLETTVMQTTDFAAAGMLLGLLVFGLLGGAKPGAR